MNKRDTCSIPGCDKDVIPAYTYCSECLDVLFKESENLRIEKAKNLLLDKDYTIQKITKYVKHTYEIEESLHTLFHSSIPEGKKVRDVINEAIQMWVDKER